MMKLTLAFALVITSIQGLSTFSIPYSYGPTPVYAKPYVPQSFSPALTPISQTIYSSNVPTPIYPNAPNVIKYSNPIPAINKYDPATALQQRFTGVVPDPRVSGWAGLTNDLQSVGLNNPVPAKQVTSAANKFNGFVATPQQSINVGAISPPAFDTTGSIGLNNVLPTVGKSFPSQRWASSFGTNTSPAYSPFTYYKSPVVGASTWKGLSNALQNVPTKPWVSLYNLNSRPTIAYGINYANTYYGSNYRPLTAYSPYNASPWAATSSYNGSLRYPSYSSPSGYAINVMYPWRQNGPSTAVPAVPLVNKVPASVPVPAPVPATTSAPATTVTVTSSTTTAPTVTNEITTLIPTTTPVS